MPAATKTEELKDILQKGLVADILTMETAYLLHKEIGVNADTLNSWENGNFGELFGTIQNALVSEAILAAARIFDKPNARYPTRCIRRALELMEQGVHDLPEIVESHNTKLNLLESGADAEVIESVDQGKSVFIPLYVASVRRMLDSDEVVEKVEKLKHVRDKRIAHNEAASVVGPTWEAVLDLVGQVQSFVGVVGWAFFSIVYVTDNSYFLSEDAQRPARALKRLAKTLSKTSNLE
jgi:hypothetical protein